MYFRAKFLKTLRIIRKHENETVNIFSNKPYLLDSFLVIIKRDKIPHFRLLQKFLSIGFLSKNSNF